MNKSLAQNHLVAALSPIFVWIIIRKCWNVHMIVCRWVVFKKVGCWKQQASERAKKILLPLNKYALKSSNWNFISKKEYFSSVLRVKCLFAWRERTTKRWNVECWTMTKNYSWNSSSLQRLRIIYLSYRFFRFMWIFWIERAFSRALIATRFNFPSNKFFPFFSRTYYFHGQIFLWSSSRVVLLISEEHL